MKQIRSLHWPGKPAAACILWNLLLFALPASSQVGSSLRPQSGAGRPNIVFIYTDDQRYDALSVVQEAQGLKARFPWFKTPNIDRIAKEGACFKNAFVVNSLCSPSRATMLNGRYNHLNGVVNNHTELGDTTVTYASVLTGAGYATGFIGKWHMARQHGKRPGFTYSFSFIGQGRYIDCPFELNGSEMVQTKGWVDDVSTDSAMAFITRNKNHPFLVTLAFKSSHYSWTPPERDAHIFGDQAFKRPENETAEPPYLGQIDDDGTPPAPAPSSAPPSTAPSAASSSSSPSAAAPPTTSSRPTPVSKSWTVNNEDKIRNYFRVLKAVDENVGRILHLLDSLELTDNTIVVFTSDNGYFLGEHNLSDKRVAYEESIRVPLLVRFPARIPKGQTIDKMVLNLDLAPTFVDLAGIKMPQSFQGKSWAPLAEGKPVQWRTSFFYEYFYETQYNIPTTLAVRTETAKLIKYPGEEGWSELFDLQKDPGERHNLYNDGKAAKLKHQLLLTLKKDSAAMKYLMPDFADKRPLDKDGHYRRPIRRISTLKNENL